MHFKQFLRTINDRVISSEGVLNSSDRFIVFGAGSSGKDLKKYLEKRKKEVAYFCDNDPQKQGTIIDSIKVIKPEELKRHKNYPICIASEWGKEIAMQIKKMGVENYFDITSAVEGYSYGFEPILTHLDEIEAVYNLLEDEKSKITYMSIIEHRLTLDPASIDVSPYEQYRHPIVKPEAGDVIVDAGAWIGDTAIGFSKLVDGRCRIFSFEPSKDNYELLLKNIEKEKLNDIVTPVNAGLWNSNCSLYLDTDVTASAGYRVTASDCGEKIELLRLDDFLREKERERESKQLNLLKMDVEGAEIEAITGAKETIADYNPKLQVCIYHKITDLYEIPLMIKKMAPKYKFYAGHHFQVWHETVLYAIA